jgi:hypothetical protein
LYCWIENEEEAGEAGEAEAVLGGDEVYLSFSITIDLQFTLVQRWGNQLSV